MKISDQGLTSSPSITDIPGAVERKTIKPAFECELTAKTPEYNDHIPPTIFGTISEAIEVAKLANINDLYNSTLMTTSLCVLCGGTSKLNHFVSFA